MKKLLTLSFLVATLASCSDDDGKVTVDPVQLQKKWYNVSTIEGGTTTPYAGHLSCGKDNLEFQLGNVVNKTDVYNCEEAPAVTPGTYLLEDDNLRVSIQGEIITTYRISKLTDSELQLQLNSVKYNYTSIP